MLFRSETIALSSLKGSARSVHVEIVDKEDTFGPFFESVRFSTNTVEPFFWKEVVFDRNLSLPEVKLVLVKYFNEEASQEFFDERNILKSDEILLKTDLFCGEVASSYGNIRLLFFQTVGKTVDGKITLSLLDAK